MKCYMGKYASNGAVSSLFLVTRSSCVIYASFYSIPTLCGSDGQMQIVMVKLRRW